MNGVQKMLRRLTRIISDEKGATAVEYGLIIAMIILAMFAALSTFASAATEKWNYIAEKVTTA